MKEALDLLLPLIKRFEGCHRQVGDLIYPYICPAGYPTQGWGILVSSMDVPPTTRLEADLQLEAVAPRYMLEAVKASPRLLNEPPRRLAAIADFVFNLGPAKYRASTLRKRVDAGDWDGAVTEILRWTRGGGRVLPGLVLRRQAEAAMLK